MIFLITDTHFNHPNIIKYCDRPTNYEELIIKNWQCVVGENDTVIHLGDFILKGNKQRAKAILDQLPGHKILVRGNHDIHTNKWYLDCGFILVVKSLVISDVILTHEPVKHNLRLNIHGHLHNSRAPKAKWYGVKHKLLKIEHHYTPVPLEKLM